MTNGLHVEKSDKNAPSQVRGRMLKGVGSSAFAQFILVLQHILLVPFFIEAWGADGYGRWLALTAFISYLSLLDLGGQAYIANLLAMKYAEKKWNDFSRVLSEGVSLFLFTGIGVLILFAGCLWLFSYFPAPALERTLESWEVWVLILLGFQLLFLQIPSGVYSSVYRATGLYARGTLIGNLVKGFGIVISLILLLAKVPPAVFAFGVLIVGLLTVFALVKDSRRVIPICRELSIERSHFKLGFKHLKGSLYFWLLALAQAVKNQGILLIAAYFLSPAMVALMTTHRTLSNLSGYIGILFQGPAFPELSFFWAEKRAEDLKKASFLSVRVVLFLSGASAIFVWLLAPQIYREWTQGELEISSSLLGILLIQAAMAGGWRTTCWGMMAVNRHRRIAFALLANAIATILMAYWLAPEWGVEGIAMAGLIADLFFGLFLFPQLATGFLGASLKSIFAQMGRAVAGMIPLAIMACICSRFFNGWDIVLAYSMIGLSIIYPLYAFVAGKEEASRSVVYFKTFLRKP